MKINLKRWSSDKPQTKQTMIWRKIKILHRMMDKIRDKFNAKISERYKDWFELEALNAKHIQINKRWTELFDEVTNNQFNRQANEKLH